MVLSAADRCDRCGARAAVHYVLLTGEIMLCAHHDKEHGDKIRRVAVDASESVPRLVP